MKINLTPFTAFLRLLNTESGRSARKKGVLATHSEHENTRKNQIGTQEINVILYNPRSLNPG